MEDNNKKREWIKSLYNTGESFDIFHDEQSSTVEYWLHMHLMIALGIVIQFTVAEVAVTFAFGHYKQVGMTLFHYAAKYFVIPAVCNWSALLFVHILCTKLKNNYTKAVLISLMCVWIAFVVYTVHIRFPSLELVFCVPMFLTVIYGNRKLTTVTSLFAMGAKVFSDVIFNWERGESFIYIGTNDTRDFLISIWVLATIYWMCIIIIRVERKKHEVSIDRQAEKNMLYQETMTDALTGIFNRNGLRAAFDGMTEDDSDRPYILVMIDMDNFKDINDSYGHSVGDEYIKTVGRIISDIPNSHAFRFGGDEFCMLFFDMKVDEIKAILEKVQKDFGNSEVCKRVIKRTMSFGGAVYNKIESPSELIKRADEALYKAKENRGSIVFYNTELDSTKNVNEQ